MPPELLIDYRNYFPALHGGNLDTFKKNPAVRLCSADVKDRQSPRLAEDEVRLPPAPFFMDLEITTFCQLHCDYCARTFLNVLPQHMSIGALKMVLDGGPDLVAVNIVGLGEPLMHPEFGKIIQILKSRSLRVSLVTNGMALNEEKSKMLLECGLDAITFSLDSTDPKIVGRYRKGADVSLIAENIRQFMKIKKATGSELTANIFCALQPDTISGLGELAKFSGSVGIPVLVISDLNFKQNNERSLHSTERIYTLQQVLLEQMRTIAGCGVALLGPNILDKVLPKTDWPTCRITDPEQIVHKREGYHRQCLAPWRTLVVRVNGDVNFCNCTPEMVAGKLGESEFGAIWWHKKYQNFRTMIHHGPVPASCKSCPRL